MPPINSSSTVGARRPLVSLACSLLLVLLSNAAGAQQTVMALEFSFSNPGARSMGFAGAFAALADDATASFANPAGLVQLVQPEVSIEGRYWGYETPYTRGGRLFGEPTGRGIDTTPGLRFGESSPDLVGISFFSVVYPRKRWAVAFFRHQLANFEFFSETDGFLRAVPEGGPDANERYSEQRSWVDFEMVTHGMTVAYRLRENLSFGVGVSSIEGNLVARTEEYRAVTIFGPNLYLPEDLWVNTRFVVDEADWVVSAGLLWKISERWRSGAFYRQGPDLKLAGNSFAGPRFPAPLGTHLGGGASPVSFPDVYGLGLAYRAAGERLTIGFEWDRVEYATIIDSLDEDVFPVPVTLDDGDELRLGAEYAFLGRSPLMALRLGAWLDPEHRLRATPESHILTRALRPQGEDEIHLTAGFGLAFERFQLDLGIDLSQLIDSASLSAIYRF